MEFYEIMINLCIGVVSGAFSSIIVSCFFLLFSTHSEQLARVQEHFENTYSILGMMGVYEHINKTIDDPVDIFQLESVNKNILKEITERAKQECDKFDMMIFDDLDDELQELAIDFNDYMIHLGNLKNININVVIQIEEQLSKFQSRFFKYKNKSKYHLKKKVMKDSWLKTLFIILMFMILIMVLSIFLHK